MSTETIFSKKSLGVFSLVMINIIAVDSLRSLTVGAVYGFPLVFFYALAALVFFIPTILVTAELATGWPNTGGVYIWVREAFGPRLAFLTIWLQWIYNVVWYPTIFSFIAGMLAYLIHPTLVNDKTYMLSVILIAFWSMTFINCYGLKVSAWISTIGAIVGTMIPMLFIAFLGILWIIAGHPSQIQMRLQDVLPTSYNMNNIAFFTNILFGLMGMEMSAVHAGDVSNPKRDYPRALAYSSLMILLTLILGSLAIAIVIPNHELNLVSGFVDAFSIFFNAYHLTGFIPVIVVFVVLGSLSGAGAWIIGPARGLYVASRDTQLPSFLTRSNQYQMPVGILLTQGVIVTLLCAVFLIMPSVNSAYWVLSNLTAQMALLFYILMFAAAIRLRYKHADVKRAFRIPGGKIGIWCVGGLGILTCFSAIMIGFIPPTQVAVGKVAIYESILVGGLILFCMLPWFISSKRRKLCDERRQ